MSEGRTRITRASQRQATEMDGITSGDNQEPISAPPQAAKAIFADVMDGSTNMGVDPRKCIPLTKVRKPVQSGVARMKSIFGGHLSYDQSGKVSTKKLQLQPGVVAGSDNPIVMQLTGSYRRYVIDHFKSQGMTETEAKAAAEIRKTWYGVVDGLHRLLAILELIEDDPGAWCGFIWPVTVLKGGHDINALKQLARHQNFKHSSSCYVETTFFDTIAGLREEASHLRALRSDKPPTAMEVALAFDGNAHNKASTRKQVATLAMRLDAAVFEAIGDITSSEHPDLATRIYAPGQVHLPEKANRELIFRSLDCRVYRNFINATSLKSATRFMNAEGKDGVTNQILTLYRIREFSRTNKFKPVSHQVVSEQFEKSCAALRDARKFEELLESENWPFDMKLIRKNLLETTKWDSEVERNKGNEFDVLKTLLDMYRKFCPEVAPFKEAKYKASHLATPDSTTTKERHEHELGSTAEPLNAIEQVEERQEDFDGFTVDDIGPNAMGIAGNRSSFGVENMPGQGSTPAAAISQASERLANGTRSHRDYLKEMRLTCLQMKWQVHQKTLFSDTTSLFDLVLTDPPYGTPNGRAGAGVSYDNFVDDIEMVELAQFCRRALKPGGWMLLFTSLQYFEKWRKYFREAGFSCPGYSYVVVKDSDTIQGSRSAFFPQNLCEHLLFARAPGSRVEGFKPDRISPYHNFKIQQKRRFAAVDNVPVTEKKLLKARSRSPVLVEEKNPSLLAEIMTTFCPENGSVLDVYAGTFSAAIACIMTKRSFVGMEADASRFRLAHDRLWRLAKTECVGNLAGRESPVKKSRSEAIELKSAIPSADGELSEHLSVQNTSLTTAAADPVANRNDLDDEKEEEISDVGINDIQKIKPGDEVYLLQSGLTVGKAVLQYQEAGNYDLVRKIHGNSLETAKSKESGWKLVSIFRVQIEEPYQHWEYPYEYSGQEAPPCTLAEMHTGFHAWDIHNMEKARQKL